MYLKTYSTYTMKLHLSTLKYSLIFQRGECVPSSGRRCKKFSPILEQFPMPMGLAVASKQGWVIAYSLSLPQNS